MATDSRLHPTPTREDVLAADFGRRLEQALTTADAKRRRHVRVRLVARVVPVLLLLAPLVGWRLFAASPGDSHVLIDAAAWMTFLLDIGVHVDNNILSSLGLGALPSLVGVLLFTLLAIHLLTRPAERP